MWGGAMRQQPTPEKTEAHQRAVFKGGNRQVGKMAAACFIMRSRSRSRAYPRRLLTMFSVCPARGVTVEP